MQIGKNAGMQRGGKLVVALMHLCLGAVIAAGCTRARASTVPSLPPLEMPAPPPRILMPIEVTVEVQEPEPQPAEPEEPRPVPAPPRPRTAAPTTTPPAEPPKLAEEPPKPASPAPVTTLQTTPAAEQGEFERAIRATMSRASADLNRIDYRALNANARTQYDTAKRFIQQADDAIRLQNLPFAKTVADKAAVLAAQLLGGR